MTQFAAAVQSSPTSQSPAAAPVPSIDSSRIAPIISNAALSVPSLTTQITGVHPSTSPPIPASTLPISPTTPIPGRICAQSPAINSASSITSATADTPDQLHDNRGHQRVYQACIPCRRRKVRCELGPVDSPHEPPCARCKRETKECFFSATRRKRKNDDDEIDEELDGYLLRNGRKRVHGEGSPPIMDRAAYSDTPLTPGGSAGRKEPLRKPDVRSNKPTSGGGGGLIGEEGNAQLENFEAQNVMRRGMYGPHDALDLLYKAATDGPVASHNRISSSATVPPHVLVNPAFKSTRSDSIQEEVIDPRPIKLEVPEPTPKVGEGAVISPDPLALEYDPDALKAWSRFRFVRAGWFTAQEAIQYIKYYYSYLSPLTPISPPTFQDESTHITLLTEEPILTVTLLTIASRYRPLPGAGGHCRSHAIHTQLWTYLRGMIERCFWGQEAFGGGVMPAGYNGHAEDHQSSTTAPWRGLKKGSLRTLGTIESLMILTEWHPRALHFPPDEAIYELMLPASDLSAPEEEGAHRLAGGVGGRRLESWLEPAWRSDRMCWMLLSTGLGLAYELGVFDDIEDLLRDGAILRPEYEEESYRQRAYRIKRLLMIYLTQLAGRLGWTSMVPDNLWRIDTSGRRRPMSNEGSTPVTTLSSLSVGFNYIPDLELDDQIVYCWIGISNAMHIGNQKLFKSRKLTTEIIQSGKYIDLLKEFRPMLRDWWREFERYRLPLYIRHILTIEYEYVRIYINSLSLQAVVERCTSNAGNASGSDTIAQLSPQTQNYYGKLPLGHLGSISAEDQESVREVVDGSRNLLSTVVEGLLPGGYLKHAPVRTYFRIISGAMFLLKTFALGASRSDVKISIDLMDCTVNALRTCVVDDVHLGTRFADLLESLTSRLRNRFIQAPTLMRPGGSGPGLSSPMPNNSDVVMGNGVGQAGHLEWGPRFHEALNPQGRSSTPGISATPFDFRTGNFPYQSGAASVLGPSTPSAMDGTGSANPSQLILEDWNNGPGSEMWYLPPGPAFFQNMENNAVSMTAEGINVGGIDLLDYMAMDQNYNLDGY